MVFDVGPLTWVKSEIDASLERARAALARYAADPDARADLAACQTQLHQAAGAVQIVGLEGVTRVFEETEALVSDLAGGKATWFLPSATPGAARKQWIAGTLKPKGAVRVDAGAERALLGGRSLLPAGVTGVDGQFERGDAVSVLAADGRELARGLVAYASDEARLIAGRKSAGFAEILGYSGRDEIIHRDDLVLTGSGRPS